MLHLLKCHWLCNEVDLDLAALLKHAFGAGGGASVHINANRRLLFKQAIDGGHEATKEESWIIQVHKDETVRHIFADCTSNRVDGRLLEEGLVATEAETLLEERHEVRAADKEALWEVTDRSSRNVWLDNLGLGLNFCSILVHLINSDCSRLPKRWVSWLWCLVDHSISGALNGS